VRSRLNLPMWCGRREGYDVHWQLAYFFGAGEEAGRRSRSGSAVDQILPCLTSNEMQSSDRREREAPKVSALGLRSCGVGDMESEGIHGSAEVFSVGGAYEEEEVRLKAIGWLRQYY
jgi:hypothetical protein